MSKVIRKASIITIHVGFNFGSVLQTIATSEFLKRFNFATTVINYIPDRVKLSRYFTSTFNSPVRLVWRLLQLPVFLKNRRIYTGYLSKYVKLSAPIYGNDNFVEKCPSADVYVSGSDQVWNSIHNEGFDGHYYYEGLPEGSVKIALSSSIGRNDFDEEEKPRAKKLLEGYKAVSVREDSAKEILSSLGIKSIQLLDPTFFLDRYQWMPFMSERMIKEPYLLIYTPYNTVDKSVIYKSARKLAEKQNLKVVTFSWHNQKEKLADHTIQFANPGDFLSLMNHADYVITNSFHGTAFSINLNKQFWVFQPSAFSTRIESILRKTNLTDRMLLSELKDEDITTIDFTEVNKVLEVERERAKEFITNALS